MKTQRRLVWGVAGLGVLILACSLGPFLLTDTGDGDPLHASLLPPLTRVIVLELVDGRILMSPEVTAEGDLYRVRGPRRTSSIPSDEVAAQTRARLWLGSDRFGGDVLRRLLEGGRISLAVAALGVTIALVVGLFVGLAAAIAQLPPWISLPLLSLHVVLSPAAILGFSLERQYALASLAAAAASYLALIAFSASTFRRVGGHPHPPPAVESG